MSQEMTGYPSIDKPWLKYYREEALETPLTELSIYEYLKESNQNNRQNTALVYMGRKISYGLLFSLVENTARAFAGLGLSQGDVVACIAPTFPETIYSFYGANILGAISDYFDPRMELTDIETELREVKPKVMLIYEDFISKFQEMINHLVIPHVIVISAKDSLPVPLRLVMNLKKKQ